MNLLCRSMWLVVLVMMPCARCVQADDIDYIRDIKPILKARCYACHGAFKQEAELRLDTAASVRKGGDNGTTVNRDAPAESLLLQRVTSSDKDERMPPEGDALTSTQITLLRGWIAAGSGGPADEVGQADPRKHWSFQRLARPELDVPTDSHVIDGLIDKRLARAGLHRNPTAEALTLIRRMFLDMHGLPPSPDQVADWSTRLTRDVVEGQPLDAAAIQGLIEFLLSSPRYGERWAQHWLDVVRYADTHGFEVNTPRPNAWPYRDYVIRAFNDDKPYNEFVLDQFAGDSTGEDAGTGFLVAAAVLLPGQIGADAASKRLARQDSLDEIIVGTTATFLGLTVGCARCHDHKFDPFTQRDYYAMQAFFAGVDYGDRELNDVSRKDRLAEAATLVPQIDELTGQLCQFEPLTFTGRTIVIDDEDADHVSLLATENGHGTNPDGLDRGYAKDPGTVDRVANLSRSRYTWWPNRPGEDVFTWNPETAGMFRIWISWGVHGSGVHTRDARYVLDVDGDLDSRDDQKEIAKIDQYYFSGVSEGTSEKKPLWSGLFDAGVHELTDSSRLILRGGETGTGITADVIVLQDVVNGESPSLPRLRGPVSPLHNIERFKPTDARFVRFTTFETSNDNRYEPCIDELEVFTAGDRPTNVALAERGTQATSSGDYSNSGKHQLAHINDGKYGNSRSWISNKHGGGWVQLKIAQTETIDRIEWARDREGKFPDRLPVRYRIDVSLDGATWVPVAQSDDRARLGTAHDKLMAIQRAGGGEASAQLSKLTAELDTLQKQKASLEKPTLVYAGKFRVPDVTRVLRRGDPEQPEDEITPHVPVVLGSTGTVRDEPEQQRRVTLANWIASDQNPLTARVLVNRIWQFHFGRGLVDTPSDFGLQGSLPSHPELLDWLAADFIENGWSIKHLHRAILSSATYQQSSRINPDAQSLDGDCRLLWRFPSRRLEAEAIRDSMLSVNGRLNLTMGGPGYSFFKTRGGLSGFPPIDEFGPNELRRMIYSHRIRMEPVPVFGAFDCPDAGQPTPRRSQSTTAIQALNLFNSPFVIEQANALADRVRQYAGDTAALHVKQAWRLALGRSPRQNELLIAQKVAEEYGLETVCRALFNSNEFLFLP